MLKNEMLEIIKNLEFDKKKHLFDVSNIQVYLTRPSKLSKKFEEKGYDPKRNFQIWMQEGTRDFRPNHLRVFIDLNLRIRNKPEYKKELLIAFDDIFYGKDPKDALTKLQNVNFNHFLNPILLIGYLSQLFIIEQEYGYTSYRESNYDPSSLFYQGWVRQFIDSPREIDIMCMSVCRFQPPKAVYINKENKKSKKHTPNLKPLWYCEETKTIDSYLD